MQTGEAMNRRRTMKKLKGESDPLAVSVVDGRLVISIGIETLAFAADRSEHFYEWDDLRNDFVQEWKVIEPKEFAQDVARALQDEGEDGSTDFTRLLDKCFLQAIEDGSLGVANRDDSAE
jgi:hypothetical protein